MSAKAEISWRRSNAEGERFEVYAQHVGKAWRFYIRQKRYENWQPLEAPPLEDWLELLDAIRRRVARRLLRPEDQTRVEQSIRERFPEATI
jgi:predicted carbohydrate-binding protein with CBM5 and CBM33 domain